MTKPVVVSIGTASVLALAVLVFHLAQGKSTQSTVRANRDAPVAQHDGETTTTSPDPAAPASSPATVATAETASARPLDEPALLDKLHELAASDPPLSLRLAREALARFPSSPNAPEFNWNVVKSLFDMNRIDEAKQEARIMLYKFPGNSFSADVEHHLLNHPPNPQDLPQ